MSSKAMNGKTPPRGDRGAPNGTEQDADFRRMPNANRPRKWRTLATFERTDGRRVEAQELPTKDVRIALLGNHSKVLGFVFIRPTELEQLADALDALLAEREGSR